jgi:uncharacterized protein (DUF779 family)
MKTPENMASAPATFKAGTSQIHIWGINALPICSVRGQYEKWSHSDKMFDQINNSRESG